MISCNSWAQTSGTLAVQVNVPGGSPAGMVVVASLSVPDAASGFTGQRAFASVTDPSGRISFTGLPFGIYSVCAEPRDGLLVEKCQWAPPDTTHLSTQHASDTVNLTVTKGIPVEIRIDDPDGLLSSSTADKGLLVGVVTPLGPVHLRPAAQDSGGINYRIIAPPSVATTLFVSANGLRLLDGTGSPVNFSTLSAAPSFNLGTTVTGQFFRYTVRKSQ